MAYRVLADLVVAFHLAFILFALGGGLLALRRRGWAWLHLPAALWAAAIELLGGVCPLTPLENRLRHLSGAAGYPGGFVEHYLVPIVYPPGLTRELQVALGLAVLVANLAIYARVLRRGAHGQPG